VSPLSVTVSVSPVAGAGQRHAEAGLRSSTLLGLNTIGVPLASEESGAWHVADAPVGCTAPGGAANVVVGWFCGDVGGLVPGGFVPGGFVPGGFVAGALVAGGFVAGALVAGGFVGAFVAGTEPPTGICRRWPGVISELEFRPFAASSASSVTPNLREIPNSVSPLTTVYVSPVVGGGVVGAGGAVGGCVGGCVGGGGGGGGAVGGSVTGPRVVGAVVGTNNVVVDAGVVVVDDDPAVIGEMSGGLS
jgi:hypothetical protein